MASFLQKHNEGTTNVVPDVTDPQMKKYGHSSPLMQDLGSSINRDKQNSSAMKDGRSKILEEDGERYVTVPLELFHALKDTYESTNSRVGGDKYTNELNEISDLNNDQNQDGLSLIDNIKANKLKFIIIAVLLISIIALLYIKYKEYSNNRDAKKRKDKFVRYNNVPTVNSANVKGPYSPNSSHINKNGQSQQPKKGGTAQVKSQKSSAVYQPNKLENNDEIVARKLKEVKEVETSDGEQNGDLINIDQADKNDEIKCDTTQETQDKGDPLDDKKDEEQPLIRSNNTLNTDGLQYSDDEIFDKNNPSCDLLEKTFITSGINVYEYREAENKDVAIIEQIDDSNDDTEYCQAINRNGKQCKNKALKGINKCRVHDE